MRIQSASSPAKDDYPSPHAALIAWRRRDTMLCLAESQANITGGLLAIYFSASP